MGQEILRTRFSRRDFEEFNQRLQNETELLKQWFRDKHFVGEKYVGGFELETWLVDEKYQPVPRNSEFIKKLNSPLVTPELAKFNVELNGEPRQLRGNALQLIHEELTHTWEICNQMANDMDMQMVMTGILPTLRKDQLTLKNMSTMKRYRALNEQVFKLRKSKPLKLDIIGTEHLKLDHSDVMLESAATSFQVHLQVPPELAVRFYNAAQIIAGPMVAITANSPYLFGKELWEETRIPLFEQAVEVGGFDGAAYGPMRRVTFGSDYIRESMMECFTENAQHYPPLLPILFDDSPETMSHLRLHNGTIWRWNRPLIGINNNQPHLRIEHRVIPGGPTIIDEIANMALFFGLSQHLATREVPPELQLSFSDARDNFYTAAKFGLNAHLVWLEGKKVGAQMLLINELLPMAKYGLEKLGIDESDILRYLGIIEGRINNACNGAAWQKAYVAKHGRDMNALTAAYVERQQSGLPVHEWDI